MDSDVHKIYSLDAPERSINNPKEIVIGNNVWLSCRTTILKGVYIGDNCVVAAGSTIHKNFSEKNCIIAENGVIKNNIIWKR